MVPGPLRLLEVDVAQAASSLLIGQQGDLLLLDVIDLSWMMAWLVMSVRRKSRSSTGRLRAKSIISSRSPGSIARG